MERSCTNCKTKSTSTLLNRSSWLSALLVILIPKCPFCVMAYTSAITICGGSDMYFGENNWVSYIPVLMAGAIIFFIMLNHRGNRTYYAMTVALGGFSMIVLTLQLALDAAFLHVGSVLLFSSIWMNGSFLSFFSALEAIIMRKLSPWPR